MTIPFYKYHGTGNDFVLIDQRAEQYLSRTDEKQIQAMCQRHFGIGADGLILLQNHPDLDFEMIYFNADGRESSMCGNGGRCIVAFAHYLKVFEKSCRFLAVDGIHEAIVNEDWIELKMSDVAQVEQKDDFYFLNTGSPHYVRFVKDLKDIEIVKEGRAIRYASDFQPGGTNVNFVEDQNGFLEVATYERGVENETLSCGTGVTAAAIAYHLNHPDREEVGIKTKGGNLKIKLKASRHTYTNIWLCGPTKMVFRGEYDVLND